MTRAASDARSVGDLHGHGDLQLLFFWGHRPPRDGGLGPSCLSQWWPAPFTVERAAYATAEHFMMAEKARLFDDAEAEARVLAADTPKEAKALGRSVRGFDGAVWERERFDVVVRGNLGKFGQNPHLGQFLERTGDAVLVEASPVGRVWGIGLAEDDPRASRPEDWRGLNLLGFALMEVRARLRAG